MITGTPGTPAPHTYNVTLKVVDSSGKRSATTTLRWTINYPPISVTNPGTLVTTVGTAASYASRPAVATVPSTWSDRCLPSNLSVSASTVSHHRDAAEGRALPLAATVTASELRQRVVNPQSVSFTWKIVAAPTISSVASQRNSKGQTVSVATSGT